MKILEIITSLSSGGGERFVVDLCNELSTFQTCEVELLTIKDDTLHDYGFYKNELSQSVKYSKHSKKCTFYTLRFGCSFAAVNTIKPQLL